MARAQQPMPPSFAFSWLDYRSSFVAGDTAVIKITPLDLPPGDEARRSLSFTATVNGRRGNSTYIADVAAHHAGEPAAWSITFVPLRSATSSCSSARTVQRRRVAARVRGRRRRRAPVGVAGLLDLLRRVRRRIEGARVGRSQGRVRQRRRARGRHARRQWQLEGVGVP